MIARSSQVSPLWLANQAGYHHKAKNSPLQRVETAVLTKQEEHLDSRSYFAATVESLRQFILRSDEKKPPKGFEKFFKRRGSKSSSSEESQGEKKAQKDTEEQEEKKEE
jgi:hypothetical protein